MNQFLAAAQESGSSWWSTVWWILGVVGLWKMFEKAGQPGWAGIIPFYNMYKLCEIVIGDPWYWLRLLIPFYNIYVYYVIGKATARAYGKPDGWAWGYFFIANVFYMITGFDDSTYYGPQGVGDHRTGEAREARTVDFDVQKNPAPVAEPVETAAPVAEEVKAEDVEFDFHQDETVE